MFVNWHLFDEKCISLTKEAWEIISEDAGPTINFAQAVELQFCKNITATTIVGFQYVTLFLNLLPLKKIPLIIKIIHYNRNSGKATENNWPHALKSVINQAANQNCTNNPTTLSICRISPSNICIELHAQISTFSIKT